MNFTASELKRLVLPLLGALVLVAAGIAAISAVERTARSARLALATAQEERTQNAQRLARIAEEEREVREKLDVYQQLKSLNVLGEERRLEWADAITRIRSQRELLDLRYRVDRQKPLASVPGKPGSIDFYSSPMFVSLALLHEEDLLRFLVDLRASGNAFYSIRRCTLDRTAEPATGTTITPRLRADCEIDLITIIDRGAKT